MSIYYVGIDVYLNRLKYVFKLNKYLFVHDGEINYFNKWVHRRSLVCGWPSDSVAVLALCCDYSCPLSLSLSGERHWFLNAGALDDRTINKSIEIAQRRSLTRYCVGTYPITRVAGHAISKHLAPCVVNINLSLSLLIRSRSTRFSGRNSTIRHSHEHRIIIYFV